MENYNYASAFGEAKMGGGEVIANQAMPDFQNLVHNFSLCHADQISLLKQIGSRLNKLSYSESIDKFIAPDETDACGHSKPSDIKSEIAMYGSLTEYNNDILRMFLIHLEKMV